MNASRSPGFDLGKILREVHVLQREMVTSGGLDPALGGLRQWQSNRLAFTYRDLAANPRYRAVIDFFLEDIYAARDFAQRNHDMERMHDLMKRVAPEPMIRPLILTVELHRLTERLDGQLLQILRDELGMQGTLTSAMYTEAYRRCQNYDERVRQIELICEIGEQVDKAVRIPFSGSVLKISLGALQRSGWGDLGGLMERGYRVFKPLRDGPALLRVIHDREIKILNLIYAGHPDPFGLAAVERQPNGNAEGMER
jgi:hypothetical protein